AVLPHIFYGKRKRAGERRGGQRPMSLAVGDTVLKHGIILAPMAGVTDLPFRLLCREQGCEMAVTEMVSAKAILYGNKNTGELLRTDPGEGPVAVQLF